MLGGSGVGISHGGGLSMVLLLLMLLCTAKAESTAQEHVQSPFVQIVLFVSFQISSKSRCAFAFSRSVLEYMHCVYLYFRLSD